MGLTSSAFKGDAKLEACAVSDPAHIYRGMTGAAVAKIQDALKQTDGAVIDPGELASQTYGASTASAVLKFKQNSKRNIRNYKGQFDDIVGKKTVSALDAELFAKEHGGGVTPVSPDMKLAVDADGRRLDALRKAIKEVTDLKSAFEPDAPDANDPVVLALQRQLFVPMNSNFWPIVNKFLAHMSQNLATKSFFIIDKGNPAFAHVDPSNSPMKGVTVCASFFAPTTNDNCRQEVVTHEFFHFVVGLQHFYSTHDNDEAMKCPHHLARAVFDIALGQQLAPCSLNDTSCR